MKVTYTLIIVCLGFLAQAAHNIQWQQGCILTKHNETLEGYISYNYEYDVIHYNHAGKIKSFSPYQVSSFSIYDTTLKYERTFISCKEYLPSLKKKHGFFEVVSNGKISVLRKEIAHYQKPLRGCGFYGESKLTVYFEYFAVYKSKIERLVPFYKKQFKTLAKPFEEDIQQYKRQIYGGNYIKRIVCIMDHYNELQDPGFQKIASDIYYQESD